MPRINRKSADSDDFDIPAMTGKPDRAVKVRLGRGKSAKYDVWQKDISGIPTTVTIEGDPAPSQVTWFNNFGIKLRKNNRDTTDSDSFESTVDHEYTLELTPETGKRYVVYTGGSTARPMTVAGGKASVRLNLGDPPIGHT
jgi:hypothetical protein